MTKKNLTQKTRAVARVELGRIQLHGDVPSLITFAEVYRAVHRHEFREQQPGIPEWLYEMARKESRLNCIVSYHVSQDGEVFKVVTCSDVDMTRVAMAMEEPFIYVGEAQ